MKTPGILAALALVGFAAYVYAQDAGGDTSTDDGSDDGSDDSGVSQDFISAWAEAISIAENVNPAYNNPGGLNMAGDAGSTPATGGGVIGLFSSVQAGFAKLDSILQSYLARYSGDSILQATAIYIMGPSGAAAANGNYPQSVINEATIVANNLGASISDTLASAAARF